MLRRSMARKLSAKFEDAATAVLKKTAELAHITGCHAFAAYVGDARRDQLTCHFFTSSALNELLLDSDATALFREQLVDRFQQGQYLPSQFAPIQYTPPSAIIDKVSSYNKRLAWLQSAAAQLTDQFPQRAFVWYFQASVSHSIETHSHVSEQLQGLLAMPGWNASINILLAKAPIASSQDRPDRDGSASAETSNQPPP